MKNKTIRSWSRSGDYADERYRKRALRLLASKGKKWISQGEHDRVLYGESPE